MKTEHPDAKPAPVAEAAPASAVPSPAPRKKATPKKRRAAPPSARPGTKKAAILALLQRPKGATLKELAKATAWQSHSVRGFLSAVGKQMGLKVRVIDRAGERAYHVKS